MRVDLFWWVEIAIGIVLLALGQYALRRCALWAERHQGWKERVGAILYRPARLLFWILGSLYLVDILVQHIGGWVAVQYLGALRKAAFVGCSAWALYRWKCIVEQLLLTQTIHAIDATTMRVISRLATITVATVASLLILQALGVNIVPLLTFGSIGAAAIGFASKDVISNFCSGLLLHITRPFILGERIHLPEKQLEGTVQDIGWCRTILCDKEQRPLSLPNSFFSTLIVVNLSRITHRRIKHNFHLRWEDVDKVEIVATRMKEYLRTLATVDANLPFLVFLKEFGAYACDLVVDVYTTTIDEAAFHRLNQEVLLRLEHVIREAGACLALPTAVWGPVHRTPTGPGE